MLFAFYSLSLILLPLSYYSYCYLSPVVSSVACFWSSSLPFKVFDTLQWKLLFQKVLWCDVNSGLKCFGYPAACKLKVCMWLFKSPFQFHFSSPCNFFYLFSLDIRYWKKLWCFLSSGLCVCCSLYLRHSWPSLPSTDILPPKHTYAPDNPYIFPTVLPGLR